MNAVVIGVIFTLVFVIIEAFQFVYFGAIFQGINPFLFGFAVFAIVSIVFIVGVSLRQPGQLATALGRPADLLGLNVTATLAWASYLASVRLIEPAVVYTISAGVMPMAAYISRRLSTSEESPHASKTELAGMGLLLVGIVYLAVVTVSGHSGFVRDGDQGSAVMGVLLAVADGVFFTWMLVYGNRLDRSGVGPAAIFGLRFPLYVMMAGGVTFVGAGSQTIPATSEFAVVVGIGLLLTVPHLYALQVAVAKISIGTISALATMGPFVVFALQIVEGRVYYSTATLVGLFIYFVGSWVTIVASLGTTDCTITPAKD